MRLLFSILFRLFLPIHFNLCGYTGVNETFILVCIRFFLYFVLFFGIMYLYFGLPPRGRLVCCITWKTFSMP